MLNAIKILINLKESQDVSIDTEKYGFSISHSEGLIEYQVDKIRRALTLIQDFNNLGSTAGNAGLKIFEYSSWRVFCSMVSTAMLKSIRTGVSYF